MNRKHPVLLGCVLAIFAGCSKTAYGPILTNSNWSASREKLGRVAILPPRYTNNEIGTANQSEIVAAASDAIAKLPGTIVVDADRLGASLQRDSSDELLSDYEIVNAAKAQQLDAVCVLTIHHYGYRFMLGVPLLSPLPWAETSSLIEYDMRLIQVPTGRALVVAHREIKRKDVSFPKLEKDMPNDFGEDLAKVLAQGKSTDQFGNELVNAAATEPDRIASAAGPRSAH